MSLEKKKKKEFYAAKNEEVLPCLIRHIICF